MLLKINLTIITIIQLTLLISFISADNNKNDLNNYLRKQFSNDLSDTNSDLKWWEYLTSDTKENKNLIGSESVAFDVVQTHLSEDEDNEEIQTTTTTRAPIVSPRIVNSGKSNTNTREPTKTRPTLRPTTESSRIADEDNEIKSVKGGVKTSKQVPKKISQPTKTITTSRPAKPIVKSVTPRLVTTTTSSSLEESDEEIDNNIIKKPAPAIVQPKKPQQSSTKTIPSRPQISGTKTRQTPTKTTSAPVSKVAPRKIATPTTTTTSKPSSIDEEDADDEAEIVATTRRPAVQPKKIPAVSQPATKTISSRPQTSGTKTKQTPTKTTQPRKQPTLVTTTSRSLVTDSEDEEEEVKVVTTRRPAVVQPAVKRPAPQQPKPLPPRIGTKQPTKTPGTKSRPTVAVQPKVTRPAVIVTTTQRPTTLATTTEADDSEDEPLPTVRTIPVQPKKVPAVSQPTKTVQPSRPAPTGTKTRQPAPRPATSRPVVIQTTTSKPLIDEEDEEEEKTAPRTTLKPAIIPTTTTKKPSIVEEDDNEENNTVPISPIRKMIESRKPSRPNGGVKRPSQPGTKTRQIPAKVTPRPVITTPARKQPTIVTTLRPSTEDSEEDEEKTIVTTRKPVIVQPAVKRPTPQQPIKTPSGTKTKQIDTGVKTRQPAPRPATSRPVVIQTTTAKPSLIDEDDENDNEDENLPSAKPTVSPRVERPTIQTSTRRPAVIQTTTAAAESDEEEEVSEAPKRDIPKPLPRRPTGTKTISPGTKTRQPAPRPAPRVVTTARPVVTTPASLESDEEDESLPAKPVSQPRQPAPRPAPRPQIITTTRKPIVVINENDEEEEINEIPERKPAPPAPLPRGVKRPPGSLPVKTPAIGTKTPSRPGVKTVQPAPRITTARPVITTTTEDDSEEDENLPAAKPQPTVAPRPQRPATTKRPIVETTTSDDESDNELPAVEKRRPIPKPLPRPVGTKTPTKTAPRKVAITTASPQPASNDEGDDDEPTELPVRKAVPSPIPRKVSPKIMKPVIEEDDENELPVSRRPVVPPPQPRKIGGTKGGSRAGTKIISTQPTLKPRVTVTTTTAAPSSKDESDDSESDNEPDEKVDVIPAKPEIPKPLGRKIVNRPRVDNQQTTIVATTPSAVNNRRISTSNMPVPRPVSFNRRSKTSPAKEQSVAAETTTLEPIPVPVFESTRRPGNPIIQSITTDNEEDNENSNQQLPRRKSAVRNVIVSSDLAKFSSRVRYAERQPLNNNNQNKYSSYSPPLIDSLVEPNSEPFIEINRIK